LKRYGFFGDLFYWSWLPEALVVSRAGYAALSWLELAVGLVVIVGRGARPALAVFACAALYLLLCDRLQYHHNRYALILFSGLCALTPCDRALVVGRPAAPGPLWAQRLMQLQLSIIYLASGGTKLCDADWRSGLVLADRFHRYAYQALARGVPAELVRICSLPSVAEGLSKLAIATELGLAVALWAPPVRRLALWWGVLFHLTIEVTSSVQIFTWLTLLVYALFAHPAVRTRKLRYDPARPLAARLVRALDWLLRYQLVPEPGGPLAVVEADGRARTGVEAWALLAGTLPLAVPLWGPLALAARLVRRM
jgi:hypothetical protein